MATEATCEARRYHDWQTGEGGGWTCADCAAKGASFWSEDASQDAFEHANPYWRYTPR